MIISSWNVNGLRSVIKKEALQNYIETYHPDILGIQETKMHISQLPDAGKKIFNENYSFFNDAEKKGYSGTALYSSIKPISITTSDFDEGRFICAEYEKFFFLNIYFPNGKSKIERLMYKYDFNEKIFNYIMKLKKEKHVIIAGDYNTAHEDIDIINPRENEKFSGFLPEERAWLDKLEENEFVDTFRYFNKGKPNCYTWWFPKCRERNAGWRIDYIFVDAEFMKYVKNAFIYSDILGSDHCPIGIEVDFSI
jgi:exodeoxyribonuclease-3